jgi:hypothetical protein
VLLFHVRHSIQTSAPYDNIGNTAPVYILLRTSRLSPQLILADFDRAWISLMHFPVMYCVCVCVCFCVRVRACVCACARVRAPVHPSIPGVSWCDSNQNLVQCKEESVKLFLCIL